MADVSLDRVRALLESSDEDALRDFLFADDAPLFNVDWREGDADIVDKCDSVLGNGELTAEQGEPDAKRRRSLDIVFRGRRVRVPLTYSPDDRLITLAALNEALAPDFEIRLCRDDGMMDGMQCVPLATSQWAELEATYGDELANRFERIGEESEATPGDRRSPSSDARAAAIAAALGMQGDEESSPFADLSATPWRTWRWVLIAYVLVLLGVGIVAAKGNPDAALPYQSGWLVAPIFLFVAVVSIACGWVPLKWGTGASRARSPGIYWTVVAFNMLCATAMILMGFGVFAR